ncbi:MAG: urease accessory protein UreE [Alphaproteobacteria bacterium]|jgi:urease accessory protein
MRRAIEVRSAGQWPEGEAVASVTLDYDDRFRRRFRLTDDAGKPFMLDLAEATRFGEGDGLKLADGGFIRVRAAGEAVADLRCADPVATTKLAWHIGNRHISLQVLEDGALRIRDDHVIVAMAERLGASATRHVAPFAPEDGAYAGEAAGQSHGDQHEHHHGHGHDHHH